MDVKESGRLGPVASGPSKGLDELLFLGIENGQKKRVFGRRLYWCGSFPRMHDAFGKVLGLDGRSRTE